MEIENKKIKIGLFEYELRYEDEPFYNRNDRNISLMGEVDIDKLILRIDNNMPKIKKFTTILHEVGHALCYQYCLDFDEINKEEKVVDIFSYGMAQFILDNQELIQEYIKEDNQDKINELCNGKGIN